MSGSDLMVLMGAFTAIAAVNWWFFVAGQTPAAAAAATAGAPAEVVITVDGGYSPAVVQVKRGEKLRLVFDRRDTSSCPAEASGVLIVCAVHVSVVAPAAMRPSIKAPSAAEIDTTGIVIGTGPTTVGDTEPA